MKIILSICLFLSPYLLAEDWPTWRKDNHRSGVSSEQLTDASLTQTWVFKEHSPPQPAWYGAMKRDA